MKYLARDLRNAKPSPLPQCPGCYKWWATEDDFKFLATALGLTFNAIKNDIEHAKEGDMDLYCIYVGRALRESVSDRIIKKHIKGSFDNSTLRKSIGGILNVSKKPKLTAAQLKTEVNDFIDGLYVEGTSVTPEEIKAKEKQMINEFLRILNIDHDNTHPMAQKIIPILTPLRNAVSPKSNKNQSKQSKTTP